MMAAQVASAVVVPGSAGALADRVSGPVAAAPRWWYVRRCC